MTTCDPGAESALQALSVSVGPQAFLVRANAARCAFWHRVQAGAWEPQTFEVFRRFLQPDRSYIDLGAWIGPTVLYGATLSRSVHALEPDPVAFAELDRNVQANPGLCKKIHLYSFGIGAESGPLQLYAGGLYYAGHSEFGDSMSGMLAAPDVPGQPCHEARGVDMERFLDMYAGKDCNFIKMDIEGGEYAVIPGLWRRLWRCGPPTLVCLSMLRKSPGASPWCGPASKSCCCVTRAFMRLPTPRPLRSKNWRTRCMTGPTKPLAAPGASWKRCSEPVWWRPVRSGE